MFAISIHALGQIQLKLPKKARLYSELSGQSTKHNAFCFYVWPAWSADRDFRSHQNAGLVQPTKHNTLRFYVLGFTNKKRVKILNITPLLANSNRFIN